jgi:nucleoside triphosphate pyrophosphatase
LETHLAPSIPSLILASASPRRREILTALGVPFEAVVPEVEELAEGDPERVVLENAERKASAGLQGAGPESLVLGVDTEVVLDGRVLGKAPDEAAARERLERLSGRTHAVLSGMVLIAGGGEGRSAMRSGMARSQVTFRELDGPTIESYLASGEWRDRAGAYAIQGLGSTLIERVEGDFSNVVGLPVRLLLELAPELRDAAGDSRRRSI